MKTALVVATCLSIFVISNSEAIPVYLGDLDRGPNGHIEIAGVTFTSGPFYGGQPCSVAGSGVGSALVGPNDWVNYAWHYTAGSLFVDTNARESLTLSVGESVVLNSITILPHFSVSGYEGPVNLPFTMSHLIHAHNTITSPSYTLLSDGVPLTIDLHPEFYELFSLDLSLDSIGENDNNFHSYRNLNGTPDSTFSFGFTIQSMDITQIPEPGHAALLGIGLLAFGWARQRFSLK